MSQERTWRSGPRTPQELSERQARVRACAAVSFAIRNRQPKIEHSQGGIAQLVERQLCKLEVRGSNPLASSLRSRRRGERKPSRRSLGEGGPFFDLARCKRTELRLGKPNN